MNLEDLKQIPLLQTATIAHVIEQDPEALQYIISCVNRFYAGDYGTMCEEDTEANNADLRAGYGHILARYEQKHSLTDDIYIEAHFDKDNLNDIDYTNVLIMYPDER